MATDIVVVSNAAMSVVSFHVKRCLLILKGTVRNMSSARKDYVWGGKKRNKILTSLFSEILEVREMLNVATTLYSKIFAVQSHLQNGKASNSFLLLLAEDLHRKGDFRLNSLEKMFLFDSVLLLQSPCFLLL